MNRKLNKLLGRDRSFLLIVSLLVFMILCFVPKRGRSQVPPAETTLRPPFYQDVMAFVKQDSIRMPPKHKILFIGSSSFTYWKDVDTYFPGHTIINRGFGGSSLPDVLRYQELMVYPYEPDQVVIYCGENDIAASDTVSAETVYNRFLLLFTDLRHRFPALNIVYVSMKPSPSRMHMQDRVKAANTMIRNFLSTKTNTGYVDVYTPMLGADGRPLPEIFLSDSLHMNPKGYVIWQQKIKPYLLNK